MRTTKQLNLKHNEIEKIKAAILDSIALSHGAKEGDYEIILRKINVSLRTKLK